MCLHVSRLLMPDLRPSLGVPIGRFCIRLDEISISFFPNVEAVLVLVDPELPLSVSGKHTDVLVSQALLGPNISFFWGNTAL